MKRFVGLVGVWLVLLACTPTAAPEATPPPRVNDLSFISPSVNVTLDNRRFVITIWRDGAYYAEVSALHVRVHDPNQAGHPIVWEGAAENYSDYAIPYWVVYPDFTGTGIWQLDLIATLKDSSQGAGVLLASVTADDAPLAVGESAPPSETFTLASKPDLLKLTTDPTPLAGLYQMSVAEALRNGKPTLVAFASPGLCTNFICTPVMDYTIETLWADYHDRMNVLHVEVYDLSTSQYVPAMAEWGLSYEPWTYLVDSAGKIVARYDGPLALSEIRPQIEALLAPS